MKGCKLVCLLAMVTACAGCRASMPSPIPGDDQAETQVGTAALTRLPDVVTGVWYPDDAEGASGCERYRALSRTVRTQRTHEGIDIAPVGSLVIAPDLIHAFAEYGEGNFHVVERVEPEGSGAWRIRARLGLDVMPDEPSEENLVVSRLSLHGDKLLWQPEGELGTPSAKYSRCEAAREDNEQAP